MRKYSNFFKRAQTWILSLAIILSAINPILAMSVVADDDTPVTVVIGEIVADNYVLTDVEEDILASGILVGESFTYQLPTANDELIEVDSDNKIVYVDDYTDPYGNDWKAISAKIVINNSEVIETVALVDGEGTYQYDGNAFSVDVEFALDITVDESLQELLLNAPEVLYNTLPSLAEVAKVTSNLAWIEKAEVMEILVAFAGEGYPVLIDIFGGPQEAKLKWQNADAEASTMALAAQHEANGGLLDLTVMINEYKASDSKVEYLIANGAAMKAKAEETKIHLENLLKPNLWGTVEDFAPDGEEKDMFMLLEEQIAGGIEVLDAALGMDWSALGQQIVKDDATSTELLALDALLALTNGSFTNVDEITNPLRVADTVIRYKMSMFDVTVSVVLNVVQDNEIVEYPVKPGTVITLAEGASAEEVLAAIKASGIEADALSTDWAGVYVDGKFDVVKSEIDDSLLSDIEYVITYSPKTFEVVTDYAGTLYHPYGYVVTLPAHADALKAYDYTVDGNYYAQGSQVAVLDDVNITRKEGKAYTVSDFYKIVADNYLTGKAASIIVSGALENNVSVNVRYPDNKNKIVTLHGNTLSAANYPASYGDLEWVPYSYTLSNSFVGYFDGSNEVEIPEPSFENVTVTYRLALDDAGVLDAANLPYVLSEEANGQLSVLNSIAGQQGNLEVLNSTMIDLLAGLVDSTALHDDPARDEALKAQYHSVLDNIKANCLTGVNLSLYEIVSEYNAASDKLYYYYQNSEHVIDEIAKLAGYMSDLLGEDENFTADDKKDALARIMYALPDSVMPPADVEEKYLPKFTTLEEDMNSYMERLSAPNEVIDLESSKLGALTAALQSSGDVESVASVDGLYLYDSTIVVISDGKMAFSATLSIEGGTNVTITSASINIGKDIDEKMINDFIAAIEAELTRQGVVAKYYLTDYDVSAITALIGKNTSEIEETAFEFSWSYKDFVVSVPGMADQVVNYTDRLINLAPSTDPAYRNDYFVNGNLIGSAVYSLSLEDLDKVINGTFKVTLEAVYVLRENLIKYVEKLNEGITSGAAEFVLVEDANGNYSIVLKINGTAPNALVGAMMGIAQGVVQGSYGYVGIGGDHFFENSTVYLQTLLDAVTESGFGSDSIINAINANGTINHMSLDGTVHVGGNVNLGGKLFESTMQLGNNANEITNLAFYITLGSASEELIQVRNVFANQLNGRFSFACKNGSFGMTLNMPEKMYEAFLAVLLVTDNINLQNINDVNGEISVTFINNMLIPLLNGDVTVKSFENTAKKFGLDIDISSQKGVESAFAGLVNFYTNADFTYDETSGTATGIIGISKLLNGLDLGELGNIIAEKDTGLKVAINIGLEDLGKDYEALFLDVRADGITNKIGLTDNLSAKLDDISGSAVIILLSDIEGDIAVDTTTVLNLNGCVVNGNLTCNGKTVVIDSYIGDDRIGTVNGTVSGDAVLVAGKYSHDVSAFIKNGYKQNADGVVANQFFDIVESDENIDIILNADIADMRSMPDAASLALDIVCDLLFNGYSCNYLEIDGNTVFDITVEDLVSIYTSSNRVDAILDEVVAMINTEALSTLINTVLDDVFNFTAISEAIASGAPVVEYNVLTKPWCATFDHVEDGDYVTAGVGSGDISMDKNLRVFVDGSEGKINYLTDLFAEFGDTISADINVYITHDKVDNELFVEVTADANVLIDWTNPDYAVMFGVIIADGIGSSANAALIEGIRERYASNNIAKLSGAFNSLTSGQVITALKNFSRDDSFSAMVSRLGLASVVDADVYKLEQLFDKIGKVAGFLVREADLSGGNRVLGSILDPDGAYGVSKSNVARMIERSLFRYIVSAEVEVTEAYFGVKLFDEHYFDVEEPEFVDGHGDPVIADHELIAAYRVDHDNKYIIVDVHPDGIDADVFKSLISFTALNADAIEIGYGQGTVTDENLVKTGTVITATASSERISATDVVEYTIIVLGDVNCDGYSDVGDAILICRELVEDLEGDEALTDIQKLACDINDSTRVDIGDATRIANKYVSEWEEYDSFLGEAE